MHNKLLVNIEDDLKFATEILKILGRCQIENNYLYQCIAKPDELEHGNMFGVS